MGKKTLLVTFSFCCWFFSFAQYPLQPVVPPSSYPGNLYQPPPQPRTRPNYDPVNHPMQYAQRHNPVNAYILNEYQRQQDALSNLPASSNPNVPDPANYEEQQRKIKEAEMAYLMNTLNEASTINNNLNSRGYYQSNKYQESLKKYKQSARFLSQMLSNEIPISLKDAYYQCEAAYGHLHLSYDEFSDRIERSAIFIHEWLSQNQYNVNDPEALHFGIQQFMADTLTITIQQPDHPENGKKQTHYPFFYDYIDYRARDDYRNYFVTKAFATGTGQCNNLPAVYLLLAEALGVKAYLSLAPQHSFIKYINNRGVIQNYEPTVNWHMTDQDYIENLPVMSQALKNRIYLDTLNKKQIVANLLLDLSYSYSKKHWVHDGSFINSCIDKAMPHFYKSEGNITGHLMRSLVYVSHLDYLLYKEGITHMDEIKDRPEMVRAFVAFRDNERKLRELGYQSFPESRYLNMLQKHDSRGHLQQAMQIDTKSIKNLFSVF